MIRRPPRSTRTDTLFPTRRSSDLARPGSLGLPCRVVDRHHLQFLVAGRALPDDAIADLGAVEGTGERRHVGNLTVLRLGLVLADDGIVVALAVLVLPGHAGAESNLVVRLLGRIDEDGLAQALLPIAQFLLDARQVRLGGQIGLVLLQARALLL